MNPSLSLVLLWHMHQPDYRDPDSGEFLFPWVYLHAIKDYSDMAWHLEQRAGMRVTVNLVPILLDQIEDYVGQFRSGQIRDPLLRLLIHPDPDGMTADERRLVLDSSFRSNHVHMIDPFPPYRFLHQLYTQAVGHRESALTYLSGGYLADLLTWYHLAWTGESIRREHALVAQLMAKGSGFSLVERRALFDLIGSIVTGIVPRYRELARAGRIELSTTPHQHPLAPLLIDLHSARESEPQVEMPHEQAYVGGRTRVEAHIASAMDSHQTRFGVAPKGMWPAEGAVSEVMMELIAKGGFSWTASSEGVLAHSLSVEQAARGKAGYLYRPYDAHGVMMLFRDDRLSDLIGFEYARWHGKDASTHFVAELESIARNAASMGEHPLVSVMLDGENAWEYFPYNGYFFLQDLYTALETHAFIRTVVPSDCLDRPRESIAHVIAGSWVYGTFSTWIGSADKNRAWDLLCAAKRSFDLVAGSGRLAPERTRECERRLAVCEASDWFWWFGDYNPTHSVASFDRLFRANLIRLYRLLELEPPAELFLPISRGGGDPEAGGAMRRAN